MICVLCKVRRVDPCNFLNETCHEEDLVVCFECRGRKKPKHIKDIQYIRYWKAFSKKWRDKHVQSKS